MAAYQVKLSLNKLFSHDTKPADTRDRGIGCDILPKEVDHSKCKESIKSNEILIADLKKQIENHTKNLKNEQNILKNIQVSFYSVFATSESSGQLSLISLPTPGPEKSFNFSKVLNNDQKSDMPVCERT